MVNYGIPGRLSGIIKGKGESMIQSNRIVVFQSDFGLLEGTAAQMYGVALGIDPDLKLVDLSHYIDRFNTWDASYSLFQTCPVFPEGTVFVSVIDPGVGTGRKSVVALTSAGHFIVTPDNGTLTHLKKHVGITDLREIDESLNRRPGSEKSHVFHGRDVYAYTGARLAAGIIDFEGVGPKLPVDGIVCHPTPDPEIAHNKVTGRVDITDPHFGMIWTNIPIEVFERMDIPFGTIVNIVVKHRGEVRYDKQVLYGKSFGSVPEGEDILYNNEIGYFALGTNLRSFMELYGIASGPDWSISLEKIESNETR